MDYFERTAREGRPFAEAFLFDCHGHFGPDAGFFIPGTDLAEYVAVLDRVGIDRIAVSAFANGIPAGNDAVARAVAARPDRLVGYARINANYPEIMEAELARRFDEEGFLGIKIHPYCDQVPPEDPRYEPVFAFAEERGVPVLSHTWQSSRYLDALLAYCVPSRFAEVARRHPGMNLILGHSGGEWDGILEAVEVAKENPNVFLDTASSRLYPGLVEMLVREVGAERVLYGSDAPFLSPVPQVGKVVFASIGEEEKRLVLGGNAARLFGFPEGE